MADRQCHYNVWRTVNNNQEVSRPFIIMGLHTFSHIWKETLIKEVSQTS